MFIVWLADRRRFCFYCSRGYPCCYSYNMQFKTLRYDIRGMRYHHFISCNLVVTSCFRFRHALLEEGRVVATLLNCYFISWQTDIAHTKVQCYSLVSKSRLQCMCVPQSKCELFDRQTVLPPLQALSSRVLSLQVAAQLSETVKQPVFCMSVKCSLLV